MDWSQFVPDVVSAVITGLVVGGVFVWFERRLTRERKRLDDMSWFQRLDKIEGVLSSPLPMTPESYRPYGDILDRLEMMTDGMDAIHPKVAADLPELAFIGHIIGNLDVLRRASDEAERTMQRMLSGSVPLEGEAGLALRLFSPPMPEYAESVREVVQTARLDDPWAPIFDDREWRGLLRDRLRNDQEFLQAVAHYRTILRQIEAYRASFTAYRTGVRWEHHKRTLERIKDDDWNPRSRATRRAAEKDARAVKAEAQAIFEREMQAAQGTVPGC